MAYQGLKAKRMLGCKTIWMMPSVPMTAKYTNITGANNAPILAVPRDCSRNRRISRVSAIGMTRCPSPGWTTVRPSTAESTEIAGVIMLSP